MSSYEVPFSQLVEALRHQGLEPSIFRPGDILIIRFGYLDQYENMSSEKRERLNELYKVQKPDNIGLKPSRELLEFLWDIKIAAIGGDSRSLEVWPCKDLEWHMHEWLLAGWGMPIGELFYLEDLSKICRTLKRYVFFLSSSPMNVSTREPIPSPMTKYDRFRALWLAHLTRWPTSSLTDTEVTGQEEQIMLQVQENIYLKSVGRRCFCALHQWGRGLQIDERKRQSSEVDQRFFTCPWRPPQSDDGEFKDESLD